MAITVREAESLCEGRGGEDLDLLSRCCIPCKTARTTEADRPRPVGMTASSYGPTGMVRCSTRGRGELSCASIAPSHRLRRMFWVNRKGSGGESGTITLTRGASSSLGGSSRGIVPPT